MRRLTVLMPLVALLIAGAEVSYQYARYASLERQIRTEQARRHSHPNFRIAGHADAHS